MPYRGRVRGWSSKRDVCRFHLQHHDASCVIELVARYCRPVRKEDLGEDLIAASRRGPDRKHGRTPVVVPELQLFPEPCPLFGERPRVILIQLAQLQKP